MSVFHVRFGVLLTSREVSDLTGFTLNQLRNDRQKELPVLLPFVRQGGSSWYRKDDVDAFLERTGGAEWEYVGEGKSPLRNEFATGERMAWLDRLAEVTSANAWSKWYGWFVESSGWKGDVYKDVWGWMVELYKLQSGEDLADLGYDGHLSFGKLRLEDPVRFWVAITLAMRRAVAEVNGWDVSDEEILLAPVGDVPPLRLG
jgi:hypothetical protein